MYINGLKYACSTCIKGHRSSHCSHVDRPLFEIRKKGRPVTQCTFCRDLRKTKQVHIKCACSNGTDKKANAAINTNATGSNLTTTIDQPMLIYHSTIQHDVLCQDSKKNMMGATNNHGQHCTCPPMKTTVTTTGSTAASTITNQQQPYIQESPTTTAMMDVTQGSLLAPLCPTPMVKEENLSYSWALITSPLTNQIDLPSTVATTTTTATTNLFTDMMLSDDNNNNDNNNNYSHLGFIFHKPTSTQRFLDGQPRIRRRRSTNQKRTIAANSTSVTPTRLPVNALVDSILTIDDTMNDYNLSTPPSSAVSPHHISSASSSTVPEPMDVQFDYLAEQLEILSSGGCSNSSNSSNNGFIGDLANAEELTAILNNVLQHDDDDDEISSLPSAVDTSSSTTMNNNNSNSNKKKNGSIAILNRSHCGSFVPRSKCCKSVGAIGGESVVITITPLTNSNNNNNSSNNDNNSMMMMMLEDDQQQKTTTRIVTCYCGNQCSCPGCLVHPGNFLLGSDPYAGLVMNPSSASSSCYGSDEEDISSIYSNNNNNTNFISF